MINEISLMDMSVPQNHTRKEKHRNTHQRMDICANNAANATHVVSHIRMHANKFALSLPVPGIHNQLKLLLLQNKENLKKEAPHFRSNGLRLLVNGLQGRLFIFCDDLKEKSGELVSETGHVRLLTPCH